MARGASALHQKLNALINRGLGSVVAIGRQCSAVAAIEFAIEAPAFFLMIFGIINVTDLAYTEYAINKGAIASARYASVAATDAYVAQANGSNPAYQCASSSDVRASFLNATGPLIDPGSLTGFGLKWGGTLGPVCGSGVVLSSTPGEWVTVSVQYLWTPLVVGSALGMGLHLRAESTNQIINISS